MSFNRTRTSLRGAPGIAKKTNVSFVLIILSAATVVLCYADECRQSDVRSLFGPCDTTTGLMESIQYFQHPCDNTNNTATLLAPRATTCIKPCDSGTYYSPASLHCEKCSPGSFSNSGGEIINTFDTFPSRFATYCNPSPCSMWKVSDGGLSLDSGNQSVGVRTSRWYDSEDESVESSLVTIVDVINPRGGKLFFQYRVESEKGFDGLTLYLNGSIITNPDSTVGTDRFFATGLHHQWRQAVIPLAVGRVEVRFVYSKDANQYSENGKFVGLDRAFLKDFTIEGVQMFASTCTKCAPGEYADKPGAMDCGVCPRDTSSLAGAPGCTPCADSQWAPVGSAMCYDKQRCTTQDFVASYGPCHASASDPSKFVRHRDWKLINSRCIQTADSIPDSGDVECAACPPGFRLDPATKACVQCSSGSYYDASSNSCRMCGQGKAALPVVDYSGGFDAFGGTIDRSVFTMKCAGLCATCPEGSSYCTVDGDGFELAPIANGDADNTQVGIRQALSNGNAFTSTLSYKFTLVTDGMVTLEYLFVRQGQGQKPVPDSLTATFTIGGYEYLLDKYFSSVSGQRGTEQYSLSGPGTYELIFTVSQSGFIAADDMFAVMLLGMKVEGDSNGAASSCTACPAGHMCPGRTNTFLPCPLGTAQPDAGQGVCPPCSGNTISKEEGSRYCRACPYGTDVAPDHKVCVNRCNVTLMGNQYDFTDLRGVVFGPLYPVGARSDLSQPDLDLLNVHRFYISPCSLVNQDKTKDLCSVQYGSLVEDAYACQRLNANRSYSIGDDLYYFVSAQSQQLTMRISGGDMCISEQRPRSTNITFVCDPSQEGYGTMQFVNEDPKCQYNFLYTSKYGCPVCTADSFTKVESECNADGIRSVAYYRKPYASHCQGGYVPPPAVNYTCELCEASFYDAVWSDCKDGTQTQSYVLRKQHQGCTDTGKLVMPALEAKRACSKIDASIGANGFTFGLLFIIGSVSGLFYALYTLYHRHTRLQVEYSRLSQNTGEMADMDDDDDNGLEGHNTSAVDDDKKNSHE